MGRGGAEGTQLWAALPALKNQGQVSWPSVHRAHRCPHVPCQALLHCQSPLPLLNPLGHCPGGPVCLPPGATAANGPPGGWLTPGWEQWPGARGSGRTCGCPLSCSGFSVCPLHMAPAPEAPLLSRSLPPGFLYVIFKIMNCQLYLLGKWTDRPTENFCSLVQASKCPLCPGQGQASPGSCPGPPTLELSGSAACWVMLALSGTHCLLVCGAGSRWH